jgi:putative PEP-CTERM system TPR-repeat lipoprotein
MIALASLELARDDLPAAEAALRRALVKDPSNTEVRIALADLTRRTTGPAAGIAILEEGQKVSPDSAVLGLALARMSFAANDPARARAVLDEILAMPSRGAELSSQVGGVLLEAGRFDEAVGRFRDAVDADPRNPLYLLNLARAQLALDQSAAASESVQRALELRPNWLPAVSTQVLIDLRAKRTDKALATVQSLRKSAPDDARFAMLEGDVRMAGEQYAEAIRAYTDADKLKPSAASAIRLHQARREASTPRAEASLIRWLGRHPEDLTVRTVLAQFYLQGSRLTDAAGEFEIISREQPNDAAVLNNLAWIYQELGDARALATARRAYELAPSNPAIADTYGWILFTHRHSAAALPLLEAAARVAARDPEVQYHYAAALAAAGRTDEARETLRKVMDARTEFRGRREAEKLLAQLDG